MLSSRMQELLIGMLVQRVSKGRAQDDLRSLYLSKASFYRTVSYLCKSGLVMKTDGGIQPRYILSMKGEVLARILVTLHDTPAEFKRLSSLLVTENQDLWNIFKERGGSRWT